MLADNIICLKKENPDLYMALKNTEEKVIEEQLILENTRNNQQTIKVEKDGKINYLHSKYDPLKEAEIIIDKLDEENEINENTLLIFYGVGLGYHIDAFIKRYPSVDFLIYEPSLAVLSLYLQEKSLKQFSTKYFKSITGELDQETPQVFFNEQIGKVQKSVVFCHLPAYEKVFKRQYDQFFTQAKTIAKSKRISLHTNYAFKKRWVLNSVLNFGEVLKTPNIIMESKEVFKDKPAILVSAGPSLNDEIEHLREIKAEGLAYIFTVGSALNTLIHHEIYPDAMCTYDPTEENQIVFNKVNELKINHIPMIFGSSVGFETLQKYQGPKYHMLTNQDKISDYFLKAINEENLTFVHDAPSIAVIALELLSKLNFTEIILVGQNLAYLNKKNYADGIDYEKNKEINKDNLLKNIDVTGGIVYTNDSYLSMKDQMELYIKSFNLNVINTTQGGIHIEGAKYTPMKQVLKEKLTFSIVDENIFKMIEKGELYDQNYAESQWLKMKQAYAEYIKLLALMKEKLLKIDELLKNKNIKQASSMYKVFDTSVAQLENNDFSKVFALPMYRTEYEFLVNNVQRLKKEPQEFKRLEGLVLNFAGFVSLLYGDNHLNQQIMEIMDKQLGENKVVVK